MEFQNYKRNIQNEALIRIDDVENSAIFIWRELVQIYVSEMMYPLRQNG